MTKHRCPKVQDINFGFKVSSSENANRYRIEPVMDESYISSSEECKVTYEVKDTNTGKVTPFETLEEVSNFIEDKYPE